jgi:alpha 1,3-mannosyltransferase
MARSPSSKWRHSLLGALLITFCILLYSEASHFRNDVTKKLIQAHNTSHAVEDFDVTYLLENVLGDGDFGEMGRRTRLLTKYVEMADKAADEGQNQQRTKVENLVLSMFPFLNHPFVGPEPLQSLRKSVFPGSKGIVIPAGDGQFRFAAHLISSLRDVVGTKLPIQVAYAGLEDLPLKYHDYLCSLGPNIEMLDVTAVFDEQVLQLKGNWAIKPFAMLASRFEKVILLDADVVMVEDPARVYEYDAFKETGTYMFHDRLLWQHAFRSRHDWWEKEIGIASRDRKVEWNSTGKPTNTEAIKKSKVYMDDYAEEQDSGMVVLDKGRLEILTALLHICWQNSKTVREPFTYGMGYGDKESWVRNFSYYHFPLFRHISGVETCLRSTF